MSPLGNKLVPGIMTQLLQISLLVYLPVASLAIVEFFHETVGVVDSLSIIFESLLLISIFSD